MMMVVMLSLGFVSCSDDEEKDQKKSLIIGEWKTSWFDDIRVEETLILNSNGIFKQSFVWHFHDGNSTSNHSGNYSFNESTNTLAMVYEDGSNPKSYYVSNLSEKIMTLIDTNSGDTYTYTKNK